MKFDLTDLRIFLSAIEGGSLTSAAAQNNIVVAAVSARLRKLEEAFDLSLFVRTGRGIRPTHAGEILAKHARRVLDEARQIDIELGDFAYGRRGLVRLLSNTNMLSEHMPQALGKFLATNPDINIVLEDKPSFEVANLLRNGEAHIGIVAASADMTGLQSHRFVPDRLVLIVPPSSPLDGPVTYSRILTHPLVSLKESVALSQFLGRQANELGLLPQVRMRLDSFEAICQMVSENVGLGVVPETAAVRYARHLPFRTLPIAEIWAERELYLCVRDAMHLPQYAQKLLTHLQDYAQEYADIRRSEA